MKSNLNSKQPMCPSIGNWKDKSWYICMLEYYPETKRNELLISTLIPVVLKNIAFKASSYSMILYQVPGACKRWSCWEIRILVASGKEKIDLKVEQELSRGMKISVSVRVLGYMKICMNVYICQNYEFYNVYVYPQFERKNKWLLMRQGL